MANRYAAQSALPEIGEKGTSRLRQSTVGIVGLGGLGCPVSTSLTAAGVGKLVLVDADVVSESNLGRQTLYSPDDIDRPKVEIAKRKLANQNPDVEIETYREMATRSFLTNDGAALATCDLILDCTDSPDAAYDLQRFAHTNSVHYVTASVERFEGRVFVNAAGSSPCFACAFPQSSSLAGAACSEVGVLGATTQQVGATQALEAIKLLIHEVPAGGVLRVIDTYNQTTDSFEVTTRRDCVICGDARTRVIPMDVPLMTPTELKAKIDAGEPITVIDVRNQDEWDAANLSEVAGSTLIPLPELADRYGELDPAAATVMHCRSGGRSGKAVEFLMTKGFETIWNLEGGIHRWADDLDPEMPKP